MYTFQEEVPSVSVYNALREVVGWGAFDVASVEKALPNSVFSVIAKYDDETVGFARVIGDGGTCYYIQEIIVHPDHQRKGIANTFMEHIIAFFKRDAATRSYMGVFVAKGLEPFYEKFGFWKRPTKVMGPGILQFWNDPDYNQQFIGE